MTTAIHGKPPRLDYVPVAQIYTDHNYQRELDERRVQKLVRAFAWTKFGAISLIESGLEKFAVVDGQHRLEAARRLGFERVPSSITNAGQFKTEAEIFLALNRDRKNVTPIERYWAGLAAEDPETVRAKKVLDACGCEVSPTMGVKKPNYTAAITALMRSISYYGEKATREAIEIIRESWPEDANALRGVIIMGLAAVINNNAGYKRERMQKVLAASNIDTMITGAEAIRKLSKGSASSALSKAIIEIYNHGYSGARIG
ncbi:ParB N-terminal domain-containing protein [Bacillus sp. PR5]|nr:ParB N-terminal domain-containing protein [Bacillus sp. PR5]